MQIRRLTRADIDAAAELTARVFAQGVAEQRAAFELARAASLHCPFMPPELCWGVFDEADTLVAKWQLVDLSVRVLGVPLRTAGSFAIAAEPAVRGDVVQRMVEAGRAEVSELGFDLMIGVAQRGAIYQRLGARPICAEPLWELDPLHVPAPRAGERFHAPFPEQLPWSIDTYLASNAARSGTLQRSAELLAFLPRRAPEMLAVEAGYLGLRVAAGDPASDIEVREVAAVDDAFYDAALRELAERARAAGARRVFGHVPADHPLVLASAIYGAHVTVEHPRRSGCMAGLVDPARALEKLTPVLRARFAASAFR
ncbi:MAG TPA: GNAT family N-acetyltransferase, partial [Polyangiales bacterium]|nr:GNAT family N-acetyltransferase [Polyangiales bacterium]